MNKVIADQGVFWCTDSQISIYGSRFDHCIANGQNSGGVIQFTTTNVNRFAFEITYSTFLNVSSVLNGGAINARNLGGYIGNGGGRDCYILDCEFSDCISQNDGGSLFLQNFTVVVENTNFMSHAYKEGGSIFINDSSYLTITNVTFSKTSSDTDTGNAIYAGNSTVNIINSTFDPQFQDSIACDNSSIILDRETHIEPFSIVCVLGCNIVGQNNACAASSSSDKTDTSTSGTGTGTSTTTHSLSVTSSTSTSTTHSATTGDSSIISINKFLLISLIILIIFIK